MKQVLGLILGLLVGAIGASLFQKSIPPEEGSTEELLFEAKRELKKSERRVRALEETYGAGRKRTVGDGVRDIMQDIRDGKDVSMDDVFTTMKPWMRQMAPLFDRIREVNQEDWADSMSGNWSRRYNLTDAEQAQLKQWFIEKNKERATAFSEVVESNQTGFVDFIRATEYDWDDTRGVDGVMESFLEGEELEQFQQERAEERTNRVQSDADRGLARLDNIVDLEQNQREEIFSILVRSSDAYEPGRVEFEGMEAGTQEPLDIRERNEAVRQVMTPEQRELFDADMIMRREEAEKDMRRVGLTLPDNWDLLENGGF